MEARLTGAGMGILVHSDVDNESRQPAFLLVSFGSKEWNAHDEQTGLHRPLWILSQRFSTGQKDKRTGIIRSDIIQNGRLNLYPKCNHSACVSKKHTLSQQCMCTYHEIKPRPGQGHQNKDFCSSANHF